MVICLLSKPCCMSWGWHRYWLLIALYRVSGGGFEPSKQCVADKCCWRRSTGEAGWPHMQLG